MDNLEQRLSQLPKIKLSARANLIILARLRLKMFLNQGLNFNSLTSRPIWQKGLAFGLFVLIIFSSTTVYAYDSNEVTRLSLLYPLKTSVEQLELKLNSGAANQVKIRSKLAARRLDEATRIKTIANAKNADELDENLSLTINDSINELAQAETAMKKMATTTESEKSKHDLSQVKAHSRQDLNALAASLNLNTDKKAHQSISQGLLQLNENDSFENTADWIKPTEKTDHESSTSDTSTPHTRTNQLRHKSQPAKKTTSNKSELHPAVERTLIMLPKDAKPAQSESNQRNNSSAPETTSKTKTPTLESQNTLNTLVTPSSDTEVRTNHD